MPIAFANLGQNAAPDLVDTSNVATYRTASWTPPTSGVIVLVVGTAGPSNGTAEVPSVSGNGLTWTRIAGTDIGFARYRVDVFVASAQGGTAGATTIGYAAAQTGCTASFFHADGVDQANPVVAWATARGTGTSGSVALASAPGAANRCVSGWFVGANADHGPISPRASWTEADELLQSGPAHRLETQWRADAAEQTASASWAQSGRWGGVIVELRAAPSGVTGSGAAAIGPARAAGSASVRAAASGTADLRPVAASGAGTVRARAAGAASLGAVQASGSARAAVSGSGAAELPRLSLSGAGRTRAAGAAAAAIGPASASGLGRALAGSSGAAELSPVSAAGSGDVPVLASGAAQLGPASASGAASAGVSGSGAAAIGPAASSGSGRVRVAGVGAASLPAHSASGSGATGTAVLASGAAQLGPASASGAASAGVSGSGAAAIEALEVLAAAVADVAGAGAAVLPSPVAVGAGPGGGAVIDLQIARARWERLGRRGGPVYPDPEHDGSLEASWFARWLDDEL